MAIRMARAKRTRSDNCIEWDIARSYYGIGACMAWSIRKANGGSNEMKGRKCLYTPERRSAYESNLAVRNS